MDIQHLTPEQIIIVVFLLGALPVASYQFNKHIDHEAELDPRGPNNGTFVVVGTGYTLVAATIVLTILYGLERAAWDMLVVLLCFALSGVPMMMGAAHRNALQTRRKNDEDERVALQNQINEIANGSRPGGN